MSNELEIRAASKKLLAESLDGVIVDEFSGGSMRTRPDLALIGNDFIFVEIKSDKDTLTRLENQIIDYKRYCDEVIVVIDIKHKSSYIKKFGEFNTKTAVFEDGKLFNLHGGEFGKISEPNWKNGRIDISYLLWAEERRQLLRPLGKIPNTREFDALAYCYTPHELNKYAREIIVHRWGYLSKQEKRFNKGYQGGRLQSQIKYIEHKQMLLDEFIQVNEIRFETTKRKPKAKPLIEIFKEAKAKQNLFSEGGAA